jgi:hypothetical protein
MMGHRPGKFRFNLFQLIGAGTGVVSRDENDLIAHGFITALHINVSYFRHARSKRRHLLID